MKLGIAGIFILGVALSGSVHAQASVPIYPLALEAQATLGAPSAPARTDGGKARDLSLDAGDIVRRAGFDARTHLLAVAGEPDAMELVIWDRRQPRNAPGTVAARIGSLTLNNRLRVPSGGKPGEANLVTVELALSAISGNGSIVMGSTGIGRLASNHAGALGLVPAEQNGTGSLGTIDLCRASACVRGYLTTVDIRIGFGKSVGYIQPQVPDTDGDGYPDDVDQCPGAGDEGFGVDATGCPIPGNQDSDGDGVIDLQDGCPFQGDAGYGVDSNGCPNVDSDGDGIYDAIDFCPDRGEEGYGVDSNGCPNPPAPQDYDGDGVTDDVDQCFSEGDTYGYGVYPNGCPIMDSDGDGYADPYDTCPFDGDQGSGVDGSGCPIPVDGRSPRTRASLIPARPR